MSNSNQIALLSQQKALLPNPFDLLDSDILEKVYITHTYDDEVCDKHTLYNLVLSVISRSHQIFETSILKKESSTVFSESRNLITNFKPEYRSLKLISCQMITVPSGLDYAHQITMRILNQLRTFSWDAKVLIALAAFSLDYGNFWNLYGPTPDQLGNAMKQLNQVQHRLVYLNDIYHLVELVKEVVEKINQWGIWSAEGHDTDYVPALSDALQEIPLVVYWALANLIWLISYMTKGDISEYKLSEFGAKLSPALNRLKVHLDHCKKQIDETGDYMIRKNAIKKPKDIVDFLKLLIHRNGSQNALVYDGNTGTKVGIEVFKQKHVLLFISSLYSVGDEIRLLNYIYERLLEGPKELNGYKKEDFKILWIPIVDNWDNQNKNVFRHHLEHGGIKWYVVEHYAPLPGIRLIREDLKYANKPILPVVNPQGRVINDDAMHIIFEWGIEAFPFGKEDGNRITQKWKWFWDEIRRTNLDVQVKGDRYIFICGGTDNKWIQEFKLAVDKIKKDDTIKREEVIIDDYQLGKDDPRKISRFWIGIESKRQTKQFEKLDEEIQQVVKSLLCLKQDTQGWALLSKGSHLKVLGHGQPMYQTVAHFDEWKKNVLEKEGFDIAFKEYYDSMIKDLPAPQPCAYMNIDNYTSNVIATITCPNASCGRVMEVTSINYKCCHRDAPDSHKV